MNSKLLLETKSLVNLAVSYAVVYVAEQVMVFIDRIIVGHIGATELAAVGLSGGLMMDFEVISLGVLSIVGVLLSQSIGTSEQPNASRILQNGMLAAVALALVMIVFCLYLPTLLLMTGQDAAVGAISGVYLNTVVWSIPATLLFAVLRSFTAAVDRTFSSTVIAVLATILNAILSYALVFGKAGFPELGVAGAGIGTSLASWFMLVALVADLVFRPVFKQYKLFKPLTRLDFSIQKSVFMTGLPVAIVLLMEHALFSVIALLMGIMGVQYLAAHQIVVSILEFSFILAIALGDATTIKIAQSFDTAQTKFARDIGTISLAMSIGLTVIAALIMLVFPQALIGVFLDYGDAGNQLTIQVAVQLISVAALFQVLDGVQAVSSRALRGLEDTTIPMWIAMFGYWVVGLGSGWFLGFHTGLGAVGLWYGLAMGLGITAILLSIRFYRRTVPAN